MNSPARIAACVLVAAAASLQAPPGAGGNRDGGHAEMRASRLLGMDIVNLAGEELGELEDLAIDAATGRIAYAVAALGGFAGLGEQRVALPLSSLTVGMYEEVLVADLESRESRGTRADPRLSRASEVMREPPIVDLIVDMETGRVTHAVLKHAIVPFAGLSGYRDDRR